MTAIANKNLSEQLPNLFLADTVADSFFINGDKISDQNSFFKEFAITLNFPDYFGHNWDAFYDCITDLSWINQHRFLIVYKNPHKFMHLNPEAWNIANTVLLDAIEFWNKHGKQMLIVFSY